MYELLFFFFLPIFSFFNISSGRLVFHLGHLPETVEGKNNINYIFFSRPRARQATSTAPHAVAAVPSQTICKNEKLLKTTTVTGKKLIHLPERGSGAFNSIYILYTTFNTQMAFWMEKRCIIVFFPYAFACACQKEIKATRRLSNLKTPLDGK